MNILIAAGGTGGHIYPALAVAEELKARGDNINWVGSNRGIEQRVIAPKYPLAVISMKGFTGSLKEKLKLPWVIVKSIFESRTIINNNKPDVVFTTGGYVSLPIGFVARIKSIPIILHESNAIEGLSNRLLARMATRILTSFEGVLSSDKTQVVGTPVRKDLDDAKSVSALSDTLGVLGGSLGAKVLNENIPTALSRIRVDERPFVIHQTGKDKFLSTKVYYDRALVEANVVEYIDDMADFYSQVGLIICRAGALTVTELTHVGVPAILIPYPYAAGDHQSANAQRLVEAGAAMLIPQNDVTPQYLSDVIMELMNDKDRRTDMSSKMRGLRKQGVAQVVADIIQQITGANKEAAHA